MQMSFIFSRWESEEGDKKTEEVVDYALKKDPKLANEFFDVIDQLTNYGFEKPGKNLQQLLCQKLGEHRKCKR